MGRTALLLLSLTLVAPAHAAVPAPAQLKKLQRYQRYFNGCKQVLTNGGLRPTATIRGLSARAGFWLLGAKADVGVAKINRNGKNHWRLVVSPGYHANSLYNVLALGTKNQYVGRVGDKPRHVIPFGEARSGVSGGLLVGVEAMTGSKGGQVRSGSESIGVGVGQGVPTIDASLNFQLPIFFRTRSRGMKAADRGLKVVREAMKACKRGDAHAVRAKLNILNDLRQQLSAENRSRVRLRDLKAHKKSVESQL